MEKIFPSRFCPFLEGLLSGMRRAHNFLGSHEQMRPRKHSPKSPTHGTGVAAKENQALIGSPRIGKSDAIAQVPPA